MINFNIAKKADISQSLLPSFTEPTDITGESFKSVFQSVKNNSTNYPSSSRNSNKNEHVDYKEKNSSTVKNSKSTEKNKLNCEDKENYEAIERKVYRDDSETVSKKFDIGNNQNIFKEKAITANNVSQNFKVENNITKEININENAISMKDILLLLQTASKISVASNDEFAYEDVYQESSVSGDLDTDTLISRLNISDELKAKLQNIISDIQNIPQADLEKLLENITILSQNMNVSAISVENIFLQAISEQVMGSETNITSLETAYKALEEKVFVLQGNEFQNKIVNNEKTENFTPDVTKNISSSQDKQINQNSEDNLSDIINNIVLVIDEAVSQTEASNNTDKLDVAKNVFQSVKTAVANIIIQNDKEAVKSEIIALNQIPEENFSDESVFVSEKTSDKVNVEIAKEAVKDTVKQVEVSSVKDIRKEYKNINLEVSESVKAKSNSEAELKATTVNFNETGKNLQYNTNQKGMITLENNGEENFSTSQNDKGNNFNYFLKSSVEAQAKYDSRQNKETQAPYNIKEARDIERLVRTVQSSVNKGISKLTVVLTPENLGKLQIHLSEHGGKVTAKFVADNENSHKLIMAQSDLLKNQLSEKGIVVDNMEFAYNDAMSKQQNNDEQGRKTLKNAQKNKNMKNKEEDVEVGTQVANRDIAGVYA